MNTSRHIRHSLVEALQQGVCLLDVLSDQDYIENLPAVFSASIGGHFRHCLEHFEPLVEPEATVIDYDARARDVRVESDRGYALERTRALLEACRALPPASMARKVHTRCKVSYLSDSSPLVISTLGREAMYAVVHAIHHYALISVMCHLLDIPLPEGFGVAPSTAKHQQDLAEQGVPVA